MTSELNADYVRVGTWLLPEGYGPDYDHFTATKMDTQQGLCIAVYALAEDLRGTRYEYMIPAQDDGFVAEDRS